MRRLDGLASRYLLKSCSRPGTSVAIFWMVESSIHSSSGDCSTPYLRANGMVLRKVPTKFTRPLMVSLWVAISPGAKS
ncbi:hypothetical protein D3C84_1045670 [compost metagenome]